MKLISKRPLKIGVGENPLLQTTCREQPAHEILDADMRAAIVVFGIGCGLDPLVLRAGDSVLPKNRLLTRCAPHGAMTVTEWWLAKVQDQGSAAQHV